MLKSRRNEKRPPVWEAVIFRKEEDNNDNHYCPQIDDDTNRNRAISFRAVV